MNSRAVAVVFKPNQYAQQFDQNLGSQLIYFFYMHTTKIYGPLSFNLSFVHDHLTKN